MVEPPEETQVLSSRQTRVKPQVSARMVAELAAHRGRVAHRVMAGDLRTSTRREQQSRQDPQQRRFPCAVRTEQGNRLAFCHLQRNAAQRRGTGRCKRLQKRAPPAVRRRKPLLK